MKQVEIIRDLTSEKIILKIQKSGKPEDAQSELKVYYYRIGINNDIELQCVAKQGKITVFRFQEFIVHLQHNVDFKMNLSCCCFII